MKPECLFHRHQLGLGQHQGFCALLASSVAARHSETMKKRLKTFAPGRYRTVINIHSPTERKIEIEAAGSFSMTPYNTQCTPAGETTSQCSRWDAQNTFATISANTGHIRPVIRSTVGDGELRRQHGLGRMPWRSCVPVEEF